MSNITPPDLEKWIELDDYLRGYKQKINERYMRFVGYRELLKPGFDWKTLDENGVSDLDFPTKAHKYFGIHFADNNDVVVREWAPAAKAVFFAGDFNLWNRESHPFKSIGNGRWELTIPASSAGTCVLQHLSEVKIIIQKQDDSKVDRLSPWATYVVEPLPGHTSTQFRQKIWNPPTEEIYVFRHPKPEKPRSLKIYECHIGIATGTIFEGRNVGSYNDFAGYVLPRIKENGYNAIQIMAIMEHAYYGSFGYQVTSFYAASSRYGTPEELKRLVDTAHELGLYVIMDLVHSHASSNVDDGLNGFDGTTGCFFYDDWRGHHSQWGSRMFNVTSETVLRFLLSNACWYVENYGFDGFRFDGVTAMLYNSRGITGSASSYDEYFGECVDEEGLMYLQLVNYFLHTLYPNMITIAEEVSGMPGVCRPVNEGGLGFDYRLAMAIPDKWIKLLKLQPDEAWHMSELCWTHTNRRYMEPCVAYCESHDQALVGDKTIAFWLMDANMYQHMKKSPVKRMEIERGLALHKIIRLFTHSLGGEAYLNFMGNEFGHPEWLDFPRAGNNWSYHYARRQWNLVDDKNLYYESLNNFDSEMNHLEEIHGWLRSPQAYISWKHQDDKVIVFERAGLVFVFNFHVSKSFSDYPIGVDKPGEYKCILSSDDQQFAGQGRVDRNINHHTSNNEYAGRRCMMKIYIPTRSAIVLAEIGQ